MNIASVEKESKFTTGEELSLEEIESLMAASFDDEMFEEEEEEEVVKIEEIDLGDLDEEIYLDGIEIKTEDEVSAQEEEISEEDKEESLFSMAIKAMKIDELASSVYANQVSSDLSADEDAVEAKEKVEKVTKERKVAAPKDREGFINTKAGERFYLLNKNDLLLDEDGCNAREAEVRKMIAGMNVKVGAKCLNLIASLNGAATLSTFVDSGIRYILSEEKITNQDFVAWFMSSTRNKVKGYAKNTATPQATNLIRLFIDVEMIKRVGSHYELNSESVLVDKAISKLGKGV